MVDDNSRIRNFYIGDERILALPSRVATVAVYDTLHLSLNQFRLPPLIYRFAPPAVEPCLSSATPSITELKPLPIPRSAKRSPGTGGFCSRPIDKAIGKAAAPVLPRSSTVGKSSRRVQPQSLHEQCAMLSSNLMRKDACDVFIAPAQH